MHNALDNRQIFYYNNINNVIASLDRLHNYINPLGRKVVNNLEITDIRVKRVSTDNKMKAVVSVTFDNAFVIHDIKVIEGQDKLFTAMPSRRTPEGEYKDIAHPINKAMRISMEQQILEKYKETPEEITEE